MSYFFHPAAEAEHLESIAYYESKRPGLVISFRLKNDQIHVKIYNHMFKYITYFGVYQP